MIHQAIRRNPDACIVVMGCFIQANQDYSIEGVNIYIGNKEKGKVVDLVEEFFANQENIQNV